MTVRLAKRGAPPQSCRVFCLPARGFQGEDEALRSYLSQRDVLQEEDLSQRDVLQEEDEVLPSYLPQRDVLRLMQTQLALWGVT